MISHTLMNALDGKSHGKHIFVFSAAGKPIFSRQGDEQDLVTIFGLLQAVPSIVNDSGDHLRLIKAGPTRILYMFQKSLYFAAVSSSTESEAALLAQLYFLYNQILFILTAKVHDVLERNAGKDLRELLGTDTTRLMNAACQDETIPPHIAFNAVKGFPLEYDARQGVCAALRLCVEKSDAAIGFLFRGDTLIAYSPNRNLDIHICESDMMLLAHFVESSPSLQTHDQNWVPICLPSFNSGGYLQAYVAILRDERSAPSPSHALPAAANSLLPCLVLITASNESDDFKRMHESRHNFVEELSQCNLFSKIEVASKQQQNMLSGILVSVSALQFFFKLRCSVDEALPAQCIWHSFMNVAGRLDGETIIADSGYMDDIDDISLTFPHLCCYCPDVHNKIWCEFQRMAVRLRTGTCTVESTLATRNESDASVLKSILPSPDHALAYSVFEDSGIVVIGLATLDSELYVAFPGTISPLDACGSVTYLNRTLKQSAKHLFQFENCQ